MAQINLLKQKTVSQSLWETIPGILVKVFLVVAVGVLFYYAYLFIRLNSVNKDIITVRQQNADNISKALGLSDRDEVLVRQAQLKELKALVDNHMYWTNFFPELANVTLKKASYTSIRAISDGTLTLSVNVPTLDDLQKYLQVFDQAKYNANFSDVTMGGFHKILGATSALVTFDIRMKFNPALLKYKPSN